MARILSTRYDLATKLAEALGLDFKTLPIVVIDEASDEVADSVRRFKLVAEYDPKSDGLMARAGAQPTGIPNSSEYGPSPPRRATSDRQRPA